MMKDWNGYRETLLGRVGELAELSPDGPSSLLCARIFVKLLLVRERMAMT